MKTCPRCSAELADDSRFCASCGARVADPSATGNPGSLWLALNIALTVLSCLGNVVSIIGIVFGAIAVARYNEGRFEEAQNNANVSKWLLVGGAVMAFGGVAVALVFGFLPAVIALFGALATGFAAPFSRVFY